MEFDRAPGVGLGKREFRCCSMNPLQWLKAIYETFGTPYPRSSLIAVMIIFAVFGGAVWLFAAKLVEKDRQNTSAPSHVSGPASTSGDKSPAITGNGNDLQYDQSSPPKEKKPLK